VRALTLIGVLEPRQGDGTYVTSPVPDLLLAGTSFVSDLLTGPTLRELCQVRRILEPAATAMATERLTADDPATLSARGAQSTSAVPSRAGSAFTTTSFARCGCATRSSRPPPISSISPRTNAGCTASSSRSPGPDGGQPPPA
jgi:hypothetical protein